MTQTTHVVIDAGAGSGKTTSLVELMYARSALSGGDTPLAQMAAITFTRKAAGLLRDRLRQRVLGDAEALQGAAREQVIAASHTLDEIYIGTIDAFALWILNRFGDLNAQGAARLANAGEADRWRERAMLQALEGALAADDAGARYLAETMGFTRLLEWGMRTLTQHALVLARTKPLTPIDWLAQIADPIEDGDQLASTYAPAALTFLREAQRLYWERQRSERAFDYQHIMLEALVLAGRPDVQRVFRQTVTQLFVDEHQDSSPAQWALIGRLAGLDTADGTKLVVVGDPKQSIYGFRQADIAVWEQSLRQLETLGARVERRTQTYRHRPALAEAIAETAGAILQHGAVVGTTPAGDTAPFVSFTALRPVRPDLPSLGDPLRALVSEDAQGMTGEAVAVAEQVAAMLADPASYPVAIQDADGAWTTRPITPADIAILSRKLAGPRAEILERALRERGIPAAVYGGRGLFEREEVRQLVQLLRAIARPDDEMALIAAARSGLGGVADDTLMQAATWRSTRENTTWLEAVAAVAAAVQDPAQRASASQFTTMLADARRLRDHIPHDALLEQVVLTTAYRDMLAGAPDAPLGLQHLEILLDELRRGRALTFVEVVDTLERRMRRADREATAPVYASNESLVTIATIHAAKGLEWSHVFLVGLDDTAATAPATDEPLFDGALGLALPFGFLDAEQRLIAPGAHWTEAVARRTLAEAAEFQRLFYVAATRARDVLWVCGALDAPPKSEDATELAHTAAAMGRDSFGRWLRVLFPGLGAGARGALPHREGRTTLLCTTASTSSGSAAARHWPSSVTPPNAAAPLAVVAPGAHDVHRRAQVRRAVSATELMAMQRCAWQHHYQFREGLAEPRLNTGSGLGTLSAGERGKLLHAMLADVTVGTTSDARLDRIRALLRSMRALPTVQEIELAEQMEQHLLAVQASPTFQRLQHAPVQYREQPFVTALTPALVVEGALDGLWQDAEGHWHIVDYKSNMVPVTQGQREAAIAALVAEYEIQAAIYVLAAEAVLGETVASFTFVFTQVGIEQTLQPDADWRRQWVRRLESFAAYGVGVGAPEEEPTYVASRCDRCSFLRFCEPTAPAAVA